MDTWNLRYRHPPRLHPHWVLADPGAVPLR